MPEKMPESNEHSIQSVEMSPIPSVLEGTGSTSSIDLDCFEQTDDPAADSLETAKELMPGDLIAGKYEVVENLASGGMGSVYKALHRELGKYVAIKVLLVEKVVNDSVYRRFEREAKAAGSLSHPNIVAVYDYGLLSNRPFIVMELLNGVTLDDMLADNGTLDNPQFFSIFTQVFDALSHAHAHGLIHRDLKPSNIMLVKDGKDRQFVKIIDFGIAKFSNRKPETTPITKPGQVFGSPLYMSPEQCVGEKLDQRSDIYSLGCVMYEALCGQPPFIGDSLLSTIYKHVNESPPPLEGQLGGRNIITGLDKVILKMLQKSPELRYQSAEEVLAILEMMRKEDALRQPIANDSVLSKLLANKSLRPVIAVAIPVFLTIAFKVFVDLPGPGKITESGGAQVAAVDTAGKRAAELRGQLDKAVKLYGESDRRTLAIMHHLSEAYKAAGDPLAAQLCLDREHAIQSKKGGNRLPTP